MTMPNFFIIGAQKAGTTSLYHYLNQHPQVYMSPVKEPFFFDHEISPDGEVIETEFGDPGDHYASAFSNIEDYRALFRGAKNELAIGEASPLYIYVPGTAERIKGYVPEAKVIALLRNPADRAYSSFLHARRIGVEPLADFAQALKEEEGRIRNNWHYVFHYLNRGLYHAQLKPYYELFGQESVGVWLYEDLKEDPIGTTQSILRFLSVDGSFVPDVSRKHNPAGIPGSYTARTALRGVQTVAKTLKKIVPPASRTYPLASKMRQHVQGQIVSKPPQMNPEIRSELLEGYRRDILKLQELTGLDPSVWLKEEDKDRRPLI
jgi:hypothetical protein